MPVTSTLNKSASPASLRSWLICAVNAAALTLARASWALAAAPPPLSRIIWYSTTRFPLCSRLPVGGTPKRLDAATLVKETRLTGAPAMVAMLVVKAPMAVSSFIKAEASDVVIVRLPVT
jgi:hypothetical protein